MSYDLRVHKRDALHGMCRTNLLHGVTSSRNFCA